ncbi:DUF1156 domain-containing protein [Rhodococcoides fascians]|uniref:DUF1156 domain-containing protein n=1 Tax=Rhodococcoides fascians TaxID=1828 RepID=UPI001DB02F08|nr:DUF1156 domain-containing protein [Rhodococcus fascians]CAH0300468.1 hypothetical protein SRABI91_04525 [Rhodococcus fascians]
MTDRKRKLIEVALPLDEINVACKADKSRKTGTIRNLHKWFAPMPLPAWRALLFAALIDDPEDDNRRVYLLDVIKRMVASGADLPNQDVLKEAQALLAAQYPGGLPSVMDPFCGGGSTLVEAQRLGMSTYGSDLNPVPVLITRTLTQLLPAVWDGQPVWTSESNVGRARRYTAAPDATLMGRARPIFSGYDGLAADLLSYAQAITEATWDEVSTSFPALEGETINAWLWARTARCPNPVCGIETVLTTSWWLSKRKGALAWITPEVDANGVVLLHVVANQQSGEAPKAPKIGDGVFSCIGCHATLDSKYLRSQGKAGRIGLRMTAIVSERGGTRSYRAANLTDTQFEEVVDESVASVPINVEGQSIRVGGYGIDSWDKLQTPRQTRVLGCLANAVAAVYDELLASGASKEWATAVTSLLGLAVGRVAQYQSTQVRWFIDSRSGGGQPLPAFGRHDLSMSWDFVEPTPERGAGSLVGAAKSIAAALPQVANGQGVAVRQDARTTTSPAPALIATDPPYFDAIGYADLSDYFYLWHRRALRMVHPDLYSTLAAPKEGELTAIAYRHGKDKTKAREYFVTGFTETFRNLKQSVGDDLPMLVVYASKEQKGGREEETRWSSILTAVVDADLEITGTWPIHGTGSNRMIGLGTNAVATYIVMVCRPRPDSAQSTSLSEFNRSLRRELGPAVRDLQAASILPVDLAQAAMGPGMQIYSRYRSVLDQSGQRVGLDQALRLINSALAEVLDEQEGELDPESRFAVRWWEGNGWHSAPFDEANKTARPLGISVDDVRRAEVVTSQGNKVQLLGNDDLDHRWVPSTDIRPTAWEAVHHLANRLIDRGGELEAASLMAVLGKLQDPAMALTYRLHDIAAKKGRTADQERYNALINSWAELIKLAGDGFVATEGLF